MVLTYLHKGRGQQGNLEEGVNKGILGTEQPALGGAEDKQDLKHSVCPLREFVAGVCLSLT